MAHKQGFYEKYIKRPQDFLCASAHKLYGPRGAGLLYVRRCHVLAPLIHGGSQESGRRAGTENLPALLGFAKAAELAEQRLENSKTRGLREGFEQLLLQKLPGCRVNGAGAERLPGITSLCLPGLEAQTVLTLLAARGICASGGSACSMLSGEPSHVLCAMGLSEKEVRGTIRLSIGKDTKKAELVRTVDTLVQIRSQLFV